MDKTIVLDAVTDELRNRTANSVEDTIAMGESVEALKLMKLRFRCYANDWWCR